MKETKEFFSNLLEEELQWERKTLMQKLMLVWFSMSFVVLCMSGESFMFALVAVANFAVSAYCVVKYVPMEDD